MTQAAVQESTGTEVERRPSGLPLDVRVVLASLYPKEHVRGVFESSGFDYTRDFPVVGRIWCSGADLHWVQARTLAGLPADALFASATSHAVTVEKRRYYPIPAARVGGGRVLIVPPGVTLTPDLRDSVARALLNDQAMAGCTFMQVEGQPFYWTLAATTLGAMPVVHRRYDSKHGDYAGCSVSRASAVVWTGDPTGVTCPDCRKNGGGRV